jgi:hypothetical protein
LPPLKVAIIIFFIVAQILVIITEVLSIISQIIIIIAQIIVIVILLHGRARRSASS